jgi:hypothetical protein
MRIVVKSPGPGAWPASMLFRQYNICMGAALGSLSEDPLSTNGKWVANEDNARFAIYFYIEIVYISTHIGMESVSSDGFSAVDSYAASPKSSGSTVGMRGGR